MKDNALGDVQKVDMGIALAHFDLTLQEDGVDGRFLFDDPKINVPAEMQYIVSFVIK